MITFQNLLFGTVYVPCVLGDLRDYRVPNQWILTGWLAGLVYQIITCSIQGLFSWFAAVFLPILILFPLYAFKVLGAGDIKLLSVAFGVYGMSAGFHQLAYIGVLGALGALVHMLVKRQLGYRFAYMGLYIRQLYAGIVCEKGSYVKRVRNSMRNLGRYYDRERDGDGAALHFTVFIGLGVLLWEVMEL